MYKRYRCHYCGFMGAGQARYNLAKPVFGKPPTIHVCESMMHTGTPPDTQVYGCSVSAEAAGYVYETHEQQTPSNNQHHKETTK